jgi:hypothetical protein
MRKRQTSRVSTVLVALLVAGCVSDLSTEASPQTLWEATLVATPEFLGVTGTSAAVSGSERTEIGISVDGLEPGVYAWRARQGDCTQAGEVVGGQGHYPDLEVEVGGPQGGGGSTSASGETPLFWGTMDAGGSYFVELRQETAEGPRVACGNFERRR